MTRSDEKHGRLDHHAGQSSFVSTAKEGNEGFRDASIIALLPNAVLPSKCLDPAFV